MTMIVDLVIGYIIVINTGRRYQVIKIMLTNHADDIPRNYVGAL